MSPWGDLWRLLLVAGQVFCDSLSAPVVKNLSVWLNEPLLKLDFCCIVRT